MRHLLVLALTLVGCASTQSRFGTIRVSAEASEASWSGTTSGHTWADSMSAGCAGFLDPDTPGHVVEVQGDVPILISARSSGPPVGLVVRSGGIVACDGTGRSTHNPAIRLQHPGSYEVFVTSLQQPEEFGYTLYVEKQQQLVVSVTEGE